MRPLTRDTETDLPDARDPRRGVATQEPPRSAAMLRVFQLIAGASGAVLFVMGIIAVIRVDFGASLLDTSASVGGFGFSAAMAIAAILLGGAIMATALADQDRGSTAVVGILTLLVGIGGLIAEGQIPDEVGVDRRSAVLFIVIGVIAFVTSLIPWFAVRRSVEMRR